MSTLDLAVPASGLRAQLAGLPEAELQELFGAVVASYYARRDAGADFGPFSAVAVPSASAVMVAAANMLQAVDVDVFELGMWTRQGAL